MKNLITKFALFILLSLIFLPLSNAQNLFSDVSRTFKGHKTTVNNIVFNSKGNELYSCGGNNQIIVFDTKSGKINRSTQPNPSNKPINYISLSYDDKLLAWAGFNGKKVNIINSTTLKPFKEIKGFSMIDAITFATKLNNIVIVGKTVNNDNIISSYNIETGLEKLNYFTNKGEKIGICVDVSSDSKLLAAGFGNQDQGVVIWDYYTGSKKLNLKTSKDINQVKFSPDNKYIAGACGDNNVYIWRVDNGQLVHTLKGFDDIVVTLDYSPDGKTISAAGFDYSCAFKIWNTETGKLIETVGEKGAEVNSIACCPNGQSVAVAYSTYGDLFEVPTIKIFYYEKFVPKVEWEKVVSNKYKLYIELPEKPQVSTKNTQNYNYYKLKLKQQGKTYQVNATEYLYDVSSAKREATIKKKAQKFDNEKTNVKNINYSYNGYPGYEKIGYVNNLRYHKRVVFVDNIIYTIVYVDYKTKINAEEDRFFKSFSVR